VRREQIIRKSSFIYLSSIFDCVLIKPYRLTLLAQAGGCVLSTQSTPFF
jgi:hypothetical protein